MNLYCLPEKIRSQMESTRPGLMPLTVLRTSGNLEGRSGEGYIVAYDDGACVYSRETGQSEYQALSFSYAADLQSVTVRREKYDSFLDLEIRGKAYSVRFSQYEEEAIQPMIERWTAVRAATPTDAAASVFAGAQENGGVGTAGPAAELSPAATFAAALMFMASVDADINPDEEGYISKAFAAETPVHREAVIFHNVNTVDNLLPALGSLTHQQKRCLLVNAMEIAMADGILHRSEQHLIHKLAAAAGVDERDVQTAYDVLLVKNQISVFT